MPQKHAFGPQPFDLKPFGHHPFGPQPIWSPPIGPHPFNSSWKFGTQIYIAIALVQVKKVPWVPNVWVPNVWVMCTKYPGTKYPSTIIKVMSGDQMVEGQKGWLPRGCGS